MTTRRDFVRLSGAAMIGPCAAPTAALAWSRQPQATISESFVIPEWTTAVVRALSESPGRGDRAFLDYLMSEGLQRAGPKPAAGAVLTLPAPGVELFEPEQASQLARLANDRLSAHVEASGGAVSGLATVAGASRGAAEEVQRSLALPGLTGLALAANRGLRLDARDLWPVYDLAQTAGAPIYLPVSYAPMASDLPYRAQGAVGILVGASAESGDHARQLIFGGVLDAFPRLQFILGRLGEAMPYWFADLVAQYDQTKEAGSQPARHVDAYFRDNLMVTTAGVTSAEVAYFAASMLGAGRIVGSADQQLRADFARASLVKDG